MCNQIGQSIFGSQCFTCDSTCQTCNGPTQTDCLTCGSEFYLHSTNSTCLACDVPGYSHPDGTNCIECDSSCASCSGTASTQCLTCVSGLYFYADNSSCLPCNVAGYSHPDGTNCIECDSSCASCSETASTDCITCTNGLYFYSDNSTCIACDVTGYSHPDETNCIECDSTCASCSGTASTQCLTCVSGLYYFAGNSSCIVCDVAGYSHPDNVNCVALCDSTCDTCSGSLSTNCLTCANGLYFHSANNTCLACDVPGYSHPDEINCIECDSTCHSCDGVQPNNCLSCVSSYFFNPSTHRCVRNCSAGLTEDPVSKTCVPCYDGSKCLCDYLYSNSTGNFCVPVCPEDHVIDSNANSCILATVKSAETAGSAFQGVSTTTSAILAASGVASGSFSASLILCVVAKDSIVNMQFLHLKHPQTSLKMYEMMSASYIPNWFALLNDDDASDYTFEWGIFQRNRMSSLYLDNFGDALAQNLIFLGITIIALTLFYLSMPLRNLHAWFRKLYWASVGFYISDLIGKIQNQVLFFLLQSAKSNLFNDSYTRTSVIMGYITSLLIFGYLAILFYRLRKIFIHKTSNIDAKKIPRATYQSRLWLEKKYEVMYGDFKLDGTLQYYFMYWILAFNFFYALILFSFQSVPLLQCCSITALTLGFMVLSAIIRPFKTFSSTLAHHFNLLCVLVAALLNLYLAIKESMDPSFEAPESHGYGILGVLIINTGVNMIISLIGLIYDIYIWIKESRKKLEKKTTATPSTMNFSLNDSNFPLEKRERRKLTSERVRRPTHLPSRQSQVTSLAVQPQKKLQSTILKNERSRRRVQNFIAPSHGHQNQNTSDSVSLELSYTSSVLKHRDTKTMLQ